MKKKILFVPQNSSHIENFKKLYIKLDNGGDEVQILNLDPLFHQKLDFSFFHSIIKIPLFLTNSFYTEPFFQKFRVLLILKKRFFSELGHYDAIIIGNDGAIQRLLIWKLKQRNKKLKIFIILDGIISDYSFNFSDILKYSNCRIKDFFSFIKEKTTRLWSSITYNSSINYLFPSIVGQTKADSYFVIGEHSRKVISKRNKSEIYAYGLPRYESIYNQKDYDYDDLNQTIVYLTSAFKWHGNKSYHNSQLSDIKLIQESIERINSRKGKFIRLIIKIHPRESKIDYLKFIGNSTTISENIDLFKLYKSNALLLSTLSTCIVEATLFNKTVYSLFINFPFWKYKNSFLNDNEISKINSTHDLTKLVSTYFEDHNNYIRETANNLISKNKSTTDLIAKKIKEKISEL